MFKDLQLPDGRWHLLQLFGEIIGEVEQYLVPEESGFDLGSVLVDLSFDQHKRADEAIGTFRHGGVISDEPRCRQRRSCAFLPKPSYQD